MVNYVALFFCTGNIKMNRNQLNKMRNVNDSVEAAIQRTSEIKNLIDQMTLRIELIEKVSAEGKNEET